MRSLWPLAVGALLLCGITASYGAPSFLGDNGVILTPNALTAGRHTATLQWHSMSEDVGKNQENGDFDSIGGLFGLTDRLDVYLGYLSYNHEDEESRETFLAHFKAQALREPDDWLNLAIGVRNIGRDDKNGKRDPTAYAVATKTVCGSEEEDKYLRLSLGVQFFNKDDLFVKDWWPKSGEDDGLFGSAEWRICRRATLLGEWQEVTKHHDDEGGEDLFNFGVRLNPCDDVNVDAFLIDDPANDEHEFAFGASYLIPLGSEEDGGPVASRKSSHHAASPSFFGDTGMVLMPNAIIAPRHSVTPMYHGLPGDIGPDRGGKAVNVGNVEAYGVLFGVTDRLEVSTGWLSYEDEPFKSDPKHNSEFVVHAKAQALREPDNCISLAAGVRNYGLAVKGKTKMEPNAYVAATKTLFDSDDENDPSFLRVTGGLQIANNETFLVSQFFPEDSERGKKGYKDSSLYGGIEWQLGQYVTLLGEVIEVANDDAAFNWGVRLNPCSNFGLDLFMVEDVEEDNQEFAWGGSYRVEF